MKRTVSFVFAMAVALAAMLLLPTLHVSETDDDGKPLGPLLGDASAVEAAFTEWAARYERGGADRRFRVALGWSKALSARHTEAHGTAELDLIRGSIEVVAQGLDDDTLDVWLVDNQPHSADTVRPEPHDRYQHVGRLGRGSGGHRLSAELAPSMLAGFDVDLVVVASNGIHPTADGGILFGAPTLFQRMHRRQQRGPAEPPLLLSRSVLEPLGVSVVRADHDETGLVAQGRQLFFNGTFAGNGRTCGTCHPAGNNLTIDPLFIATLPTTDPLFVAEFVPALRAGFENPPLMRKAGLILENLDGFDKPGVMRGVPHTFAMATGLEPSALDGSSVPPNQRTGWSGDGSPGGGTLREFSIGAVTQHFTRTLGRRAGVDFRLPTDAELDAMEAFMLSVGRREELNLATLSFRSEVVEIGRRIFNNDTGSDVAQGRCLRCHENGGARVVGTSGNGNFNTGTVNLPVLPAKLIDAATPRDGGFGRQVNAGGGLGDGSFNTAPLVEAADTGPFFHNNAVATIEAAVAFYASDAFTQSPSGQFLGPIRLSATEISAVASFLRVLNALENIRQAAEEGDRSLTANNIHRARVHIGQSIEETRDALDVLRGAGLHPIGVLRLTEALALLQQAFNEPNKNRREPLVAQAKLKNAEARADMIR
jgi:mono/diheme cytochrome c family protein